MAGNMHDKLDAIHRDLRGTRREGRIASKEAARARASRTRRHLVLWPLRIFVALVVLARVLDGYDVVRAVADKVGAITAVPVLPLPGLPSLGGLGKLIPSSFPLGMPAAAGSAYVAAAAAMPTCGLNWSVLAGIGQVETSHGTYGGTTVDDFGNTTPHILGPVLDGSGVGGNTEPIWDTDGGALDGDDVYDRAVGPMQFIPTTWATLGRDGNGDGRADPHNLYDAAAAAATLLCDAGPLSDPGATRAAVMRYNNSSSYAADVLERASGFAAQTDLTLTYRAPVELVAADVPQGNLKFGWRLDLRRWWDRHNPGPLAWIDRSMDFLLGDCGCLAATHPSRIPATRTAVYRPAVSPRDPSATPAGYCAVEGEAGLDVAFRADLAAMIAAAPGPITILSGCRTPTHQIELWTAALVTYGDESTARQWVAPAGVDDDGTLWCNSNHCFGTAADLTWPDDTTMTWAHTNGPDFGVCFPLHDGTRGTNEGWHSEPCSMI